MNRTPSLIFLGAACLAAISVRAQQPCPATIPTPPPGISMFNGTQESDLGDAIAEQIQRQFHVIDDENAVGRLRKIGNALVRQLPDTGLRFQFFLFDLPVANAYSMPGGRIYVSRKLVAFTKSEDELAAVLGHELGHLVMRQQAGELSSAFRLVLGVTQVGDRADIFAKWNQFVDNVGRNPGAIRSRQRGTEKNQLEADNVGLMLAARAGYDPKAMVEFWDRYADTKGKTGGFFSDLFGTTKPEAQRLRELQRALGTLPASCVEKRAEASVDYARWQSAVVAYTGLGHKEMLHGVLAKRVLEPPLRSDISHLRFSPDGKYLLAQDDTTIYVLTHHPLEVLFQIEAPEAHYARFTPDSQTVVFYTPGLRVERWSIEEQQPEVKELFLHRRCLQTALSPDGKVLACYDTDFTLTLMDVATEQPVFQKKNFYSPSTVTEVVLLYLARFNEELAVQLINLEFSADGRIFAAAARNPVDQAAVAVDLTTKAVIPLRGQLKRLMAGGFTFLSDDKIVGLDPDLRENKSGVASFPGGEMLTELTLGRQNIEPATKGNLLLLRPINKYPVGVMNLETKKIFMANKTAALDIYDREFVSERTDGVLSLLSADSEQPMDRVLLPRASLGRLRATAVSPDLKWLAVSQRSRGAVWNLATGERVVHTRGFRGAYFSDDGALYADYPKDSKDKESERMVARVDLQQNRVVGGQPLKEDNMQQYGPYLLLQKRPKRGEPGGGTTTLEVRDAKTMNLLWTRVFLKEAPTLYVEPNAGTVLLRWAGTDAAAREELQSESAVKGKLSADKLENEDHFLEVADLKSGKVLGGLFVGTNKGSFRISDAFADADWVVVEDNQNRTLLYSLTTGEQKGKFFGSRATLSKSGTAMCLENERGKVSVYDLKTMEKRDELVFTSPISLLQLSEDGNQLFVLTAGQATYLLNLQAGPSPRAAK